MSFLKWFSTGKTDAELKLMQLQRQLENCDDYIMFLTESVKRGFAVQISLTVDGQTAHSGIMVNSKNETGFKVLEYLYNVAAAERLKIRDGMSALGKGAAES